MTANGGPHVLHPVNREVEQVVHDFLSTQLELKGHRWSPRSNVPTASGAATTTGLDAPSRKRIKDALSHLTAELLAQAAPRLTSLIEDLEVPSPPSDLGYNSFKSIAVAILADGYGWNHVLTLMVFSSELAYQAGVTKGHPELVDNVSDWLTTYISQPDFLSWINSHDRWVSDARTTCLLSVERDNI